MGSNLVFNSILLFPLHAQAKTILASSSPRRSSCCAMPVYHLLNQAAEIDETPQRGEGAQQYALRLAQEKATTVAKKFPQDLVMEPTRS